jgi:hypothetical protein
MTPTVEAMRQRANALLGVEYNHAVVLLYRTADDCIGYHKDKTLDLDETTPIVSISLGVPRLYTLRDNIHNPKAQQDFVLPSGSLLALGPATNQHWYHSVRPSDVPTAGARISITFRRVLTFRDPGTDALSGQGASYQSTNWPTELHGRHLLDEDETTPSPAASSTDPQ